MSDYQIPEPDKLTCGQIIHLINETRDNIWENETIDKTDIDYKTMTYIINRLKNVFIDAMDTYDKE
jgi:hypothetical protein